MAALNVQIVEDDFPNVREVDLKLIELAKVYDGKIVTNDFNLNKVAQLHGVDVLNINELANALKPVVLPGEIMQVFILKEGKEYNQGVAYLDDGTMVVVDNARKLIAQDHRHRRHQRAADHGRQDDLRQVRRARRAASRPGSRRGTAQAPAGHRGAAHGVARSLPESTGTAPSAASGWQSADRSAGSQPADQP